MGRDVTSLRRHYKVERELADRLREASCEDRKKLYRTVYDELFLRVSDHPMNLRKINSEDQRNRTEQQLRLLSNFLKPQAVYLELGPGDCHLARAVAGRVGRVLAVDVSEVISEGDEVLKNFSMIISDGVHIEVPAGTVDVAYSNQLMEHLHPDDATEQLRDVIRSLAPGGIYLCITPHRYSGPHDISGHFSDVPQGFHLKEYSHHDLRELFRSSGFASVGHWAAIKGRFFRVPGWIVLGLEATLARLPRRWQKRLAGASPLSSIFGNTIVVGYQ